MMTPRTPGVRALLAGVVLCTLVCWGCSPTLSTMTPAQVTGNQGNHVHLGVQLDTNIPVTGIFELVDAAFDLGQAVVEELEEGEQLTEEQFIRVLDGALALLIQPPGVSAGASGAWGINEFWEVDLRVTTADIRLGTRLQFLNAEDHHIDASVGLGLGVGTFSLPKILYIISIEGSNRFTIDVPLHFGRSWDLGHVWFGSKLVYAHYGYDLNIEIGPASFRTAGFTGDSVYLLGQVGGAIGWKYVWFAAELTLGGLLGHAEFDILEDVANYDQTTIGVLVVPTVGIIARF